MDEQKSNKSHKMIVNHKEKVFTKKFNAINTGDIITITVENLKYDICLHRITYDGNHEIAIDIDNGRKLWIDLIMMQAIIQNKVTKEMLRTMRLLASSNGEFLCEMISDIGGLQNMDYIIIVDSTTSAIIRYCGIPYHAISHQLDKNKHGERIFYKKICDMLIVQRRHEIVSFLWREARFFTKNFMCNCGINDVLQAYEFKNRTKFKYSC